MKLAIVGGRGFPSTYGGYETLVRYLAPYLVTRGHSVTVYSRARHENRWVWDTEGVRCIATPGIETKSLSTLTHGLTSSLDATVRGYDAMLVLNIANGFWLPLLRMARVPAVVNTDGLEWERGKWSATGQRLFEAGARMTARYADALVCDSRAIGRIWKERFGRESVYISYGASLVESVGGQRLWELGLDSTTTPYALVVARLAPENNIGITLDALEQLGDDAPLAVVVGTANFDAPIEARLTHLEAEGKVRWLGHVSDQELLSQLWANCGVYVHGHSVGGTNPALLQALGAGAPTLALDTAFNAEVLDEPSQLFPPDASVLASRIRSVIGSPSERRAMREHGMALVRERYQWQRVCEQYEETLARVSRARRTVPSRSPSGAG